MHAVSNKQLVKSHSGLRMVDKDTSISAIYLQEPQWTPDKDCFNCMDCENKFDFMNRKHHCRRCGRCLCHNCCSQKFALPRMNFVDPVRQCKSCVKITEEESIFFEKHLKGLLTGGTFSYSVVDAIRGSLSEEQIPSVLCRLSADHKLIAVETPGQQSRPEAIALCDIQSCRVCSQSNPDKSALFTDIEGNIIPCGVEICYRDSCCELKTVHLDTIETVSNSTRKNAIAWIISLQKAMKLVFQTTQVTNRLQLSSMDN